MSDEKPWSGIKSLREKYDLTQEQLAQLMGVSRGMVAQWETGACTPNHRTRLSVYWLDYRLGPKA